MLSGSGVRGGLVIGYLTNSEGRENELRLKLQLKQQQSYQPEMFGHICGLVIVFV